MLIIKVREGEHIDKALRRYKKKYKQLNIIKEVRARSFFKKPSIVKKEKFQKARYIQAFMDDIDA